MIGKNKVFVIAEMANSHEGDILLAKKIVDYAASANVDAIKFQKFTADELVERDHENYDLFKKLEMTRKEWNELIKYAQSKHLQTFVDIFGIKSAKDISQFKIDGYKIHSTDLSNPYLLQFLSRKNMPVLLSTAGSLLNEIDEALKTLLKTPKEIILMYGFQGYPTKLEDINLLHILELQKKYCLPLGIMDHAPGDSEMAPIIPLLGITLGATVIEKHITHDRSKKGLDYYSALNPDEFSRFVSLIRMTETCLGKKTFKLSQNELKYRLDHKKNPIAKQFIRKGTLLQGNMFEYKRTRQKENSVTIYEFQKRKISKNVKKGLTLTKDMIDKKSKKVAAVIACRVHSSRMFAKQLQLVGDYPILQHVINQIRKSTLVDEIILGISEKEGNEVFIKFAKENQLKFILGDDKDVLKRLIDGAKYVNADIVFRITPENPFIYWEGIDPLIQKHISGNFDFSYLIDVPLGSGFEVINVEALELSHKLGSDRHRSELCSLYIHENKNKFKIFRFKPSTELQRDELRLTVDTPQDLLVARKIYDAIGKVGNYVPLKEVIKFLDDNPDVPKINSDVPIGVSRIWW